MFEIKKCPVCRAASGQVCVGTSANVLEDVPHDIRQAGINAVLLVVAKSERVSVATMMCLDCRHFYVTPTFDEDEIRRFYSGEMFELTRAEYRKSEAASGLSWAAQHGIKQESQSRLLQEGSELRPRLLREFVLANGVGKSASPRRILDVGGMDGSLISLFPEAERYVFDLNPKPGIAEGVTFLRDAEEVQRAGKFDLLVMSHVLEHEPDPLGSLVRFAECVDEGGGVYLEVPMEYQSAYVRKRGFPIGGHINFFTAMSLQRLAVGAGLTVRQVKSGVFPYGEMRIPIIKLFAEKKSGTGGRPLRSRLFLLDLCYDLYLLMKHRHVRRG